MYPDDDLLDNRLNKIEDEVIKLYKEEDRILSQIKLLEKEKKIISLIKEFRKGDTNEF